MAIWFLNNGDISPPTKRKEYEEPLPSSWRDIQDTVHPADTDASNLMKAQLCLYNYNMNIRKEVGG